MAISDSAGFLNPTGAGHPPAHPELVLEVLPWGMLVLAADGTITYLNAAAAALWGVPATGVVGQQPARVVPAVLPPDLVQALGQPQPELLEYWLPHTRQWISLRTVPAPEGQRWVFWDNVTARKQAEATQQRSHELLQRTIDSSLDLVQVFEAVRDEQGQVVDFAWVLNNAAAEQVYGDVMGQRLCQRNPGVIEEGIFDTFKQVLETGVPDQSERHYVHEQFDGWFLQSTVRLGDGVTTTTHDITARKQAEQQLRATKELLQAVLDSSRFEVQAFRAVRDAEGRIVDFTWLLTNQTWADSYGGDMTGKSLLQQNPGVVETGLFEKFVHVTETGVPVDHEQYYAHEQFNGWFHQTLVKLGDGFVMNTLDITARKQAEQQLRQSQHLVQAVFDVSLNPIAYYKAVRDAAGRIIDFEFQLENQVARRYAVQDRRGQRHSEAYPGILDTEVFRLYCAVVETGEPLDAEVQINLKGVERWFHLQAARLDDGLVATAVDVTERKLAQAEILSLQEELARKATDRYYSLFATMEEGVSVLEMIYDAAGRPVDMRWVEVNPAFERITGLKDVAGKLTSSFMPTEQYWLDAYDSVVKTGQSLRYENYHAGINQWYRTHTSRIGGPESRIVANVFEDVTERKQQEARLRAAAAAETFRLALADALAPLNSPEAIQEAVTRTARRHFGADRCYYCEIENGQAIIRRDAAAEGLPSVAGTYPLADFALLQAVIEAGQPFIVHDVRQDPSVDENLRQLCGQLQVISCLAVPVLKNGQPAGVLSLGQSQPRDWTAADAALAAEVAERTWAAVQRANVEAALRDSEATLAAVFDALPVGIGLTGTDGHLTLANHQMRRYLPTGIMPSRDATQLPRWYAVGPDGHPLPPTAFPGARAQRGERVVPGLEMLHTPAEGPPVWTQVFAVPMRYRHDQVAGHITVILDIDARKRAEEALRRSEEKYRTLFETIDEGFCVQELVFDQDGQAVDLIYQEANAAFERHTGLAGANCKRASEVFPRIEPYWFEALTRVYQTGVMERAEGYNADTGRWLSAQYLRIGHAGSPFIAAVFSDITERKHHEQRQAFLLQLSDALRAEPTADAVATRALDLLSEQLGLDRCYIAEYHLEADHADIPYQVGNERVPPLPAGGIRLSDFPEAFRVVFDRTLVIDDVADADGLSATDRQNIGSLGLWALVAATLRQGEHRPHWVIVAVSATPRRWTSGEIALLEEVTERTWTALQRAHTEAALRLSEQRLRLLTDAMPALIAFSDTKLRYRFTNRYYQEWFGRTPEELQGRHLREFLGEAAFARILPHAEAALAGQHQSFETEIPFQGGGTRYVRSEFVPERRPDGSVAGYYSLVVDITERKQAEQHQQFLLHLSDALRTEPDADALAYRALTMLSEQLGVDRCYVGLYHLATDQATFPYQVGNHRVPPMPAAVRLSDFPDALRITYDRTLVIDDLGQAEGLSDTDRQNLGALGFGALVVATLRGGNAGPQWAIVAISAAARHWTTGEVALLEEATERTWAAMERAKAEASLHASEEKFRTLFESIDEGFCLVELLTDGQGAAADFRLLEVNPMFERQTGLAEARGRLLSELAPGTEQHWLDAHAQVVHTGQPLRFEQYHAATQRWYEVYSSRVDGPGSRQLALVFNDITERKHREQEQAFLLRFSDALRAEPTVDAVAHRALSLFIEQLGLDRSYLTTYHLDENRADVDYQLGNDSVPPLPAYFVLSDYPEAFKETHQHTVVIEDDWERQGLSEAEQHHSKQLGMRAMVGATLRKENKPLWSLVVISSRPQRWTPGEIALVEEAAERTWAALERARAEAALRESEQRLQTLIANLPGAAVFIVDRALRYQLAEGEALRAVGYTPADFRGRRVRELVPPGQWSTYRRLYRQALAGRAFEHEHTQGGRTFLTRGVPLPGPGGAVEAMLAVSYDITARKQAEEALLASELKYRTLFESMDQGFGIGEVIPADEAAGTPLNWQWLEVNPPFERLTGLPRAAVLSQSMRELVPGLEEIWFERYAHVAATGETVNFEAYSPVLERWFDVYAFALGPPDRRRVAVLFSNTSEQKQVELVLREAEARYREQLEQQVAERTRELRESRDLLQTVFDTNLIAMSVQEAVRDEASAIQDFRLRLVSRELARETGRTDLEGKLYAQEYPGIRDVGIFDLAVRAVETGEPQGMEYYYPHEGFFKWFACQFVKLGDGVVATNLDITERKTAEQERLRNLRLLEQAEAVAGLGSWDYDLATGTIRWSDGMYHLFGLPVGSAVAPSHYLDVVVVEDRPRAEQLVRQLTAGHGFEETLRLRVGEQTKTVRMKAVVLPGKDDQPARVLGVDVDISELQRLEADNLRLRLTQQQALFEAVQAAQEAERGRIAESLHNGVGQVLYATKLQLDQVRVAGPALERTAELLADAIRQTRAISHELVPMILNEYGLETALQDICRKLGGRALRFTCHIDLGDLTQPLPRPLQVALYRMAQELGQNVVKHARASEASLALEAVPGFVLLRVEDNGVGFPPEVQSTGLGLRSIRDRVTLLGGHMELGSSPTVGTYVRLRLPLPAAAV